MTLDKICARVVALHADMGWRQSIDLECAVFMLHHSVYV